MNNFEELQLLPMMEFSFNTLPRWAHDIKELLTDVFLFSLEFGL